MLPEFNPCKPLMTPAGRPIELLDQGENIKDRSHQRENGQLSPYSPPFTQSPPNLIEKPLPKPADPVQCTIVPGRGAVWLARLNGVQEVAGSNPVAPTFARLTGTSSCGEPCSFP